MSKKDAYFVFMISKFDVLEFKIKLSTASVCQVGAGDLAHS